METIGICCDHAGFGLKEQVKGWLAERGIAVEDFGCHSTDSVDYPDYAHPLGTAIQSGQLSRGISICGSGNGISMVMNKYPAVRAALCWNVEIAQLARQHNNANVLSLPARFLTEEQAQAILAAYLDTPFEGGRHQTRIDKIPIR
ncbi:ribose 5-phosphate isomerase B [Porphyromonas loveana]|uniref:Ribose-5-phosphate isomerase n=1 Tax=Porphyromonas loveana TaxID=1884669 RepID=A0A2U1FHK1_9PORP|nr:ribose 5-phosphate isomerase B [Porphyromonas loveana]PVZ11655.1 ribose-5-phosphate isomerase [Porphyromonas loveana]